MDRSLFVLLLLSGLFWSSSAQYHYINLRMSWSEAQSYCRQTFTDLVTVDAMEDVDGLMNAVDAGYSGSVWIGLKRGRQKRWGWSNGENTSSQYFNWESREPDGTGDCVSIRGHWYDDACDYKQDFVCYKKNSGYSLIQIDKSWSDAQSYCRQYYTDLVTIHNSGEDTQMANMKPGWFIWTGLFRDSWEWSDQSNHFFRYWAAGQPSQSSGSDDCAAMSTTDSGKWSQYSCDLQYPFICYGDYKLIKQQIVRLELSCNGECALNHPSLQTAVLNKISEKLKIMGLKGGSKISWRQGEGEEVFHKEKKQTAVVNSKCKRQ